MANTLRQKFGIDRQFNSEEGSIKSSAGVFLGGAVVGIAGVVLVVGGVKNFFPGFGGEFATQTITPKETVIKAKTIDIVPVSFDCTSMAAYDAGDIYEKDEEGNDKLVRPGSEAVVKAHGFVHGAHANKAKAVALVCASDVQIETENTSINVAKNAVNKSVDVNIESMAFNMQFNEPDTLIVDTSGGWTELLGNGAGVADSIADGFCQIFTAWNCDDGVANPADALKKTSEEDQAKTEQYLRIKILEEIQNKCLAGDWESFKLAITTAYKRQAVEQGFSEDMVTVRFVDSNGKEVTAMPDFAAKMVQALIDKGAITGNLPDGSVEINENSKTVVDCTSLVPRVTSSDLAPTKSLVYGATN